MPPEKRGPRPGGNGRGPLECIAAVNSDGSDHSLEILTSQLVPHPVRPDEIPELRAIFWRQVVLGHRLPAEIDVIVIEGDER